MDDETVDRLLRVLDLEERAIDLDRASIAIGIFEEKYDDVVRMLRIGLSRP